MKLIPLLLLAVMNAGAQIKIDSTVRSKWISGSEVLIWHDTPYVDTIPIGKLDTVAIKMLVSDNRVGEGTVPAFVIRGYEVNIRQPYINEPGTFCWNCPNYWQHVMYLDYKRRPLGKHIEVWQVN